MCNDPLQPHETIVCDDCDCQLAAATDTVLQRRVPVNPYPVTTEAARAMSDLLALWEANAERDTLLAARARFQDAAESCHQDYAQDLMEAMDALLLYRLEQRNER